MIDFQNVSFTYGAMEGQYPVRAVSDVSFTIERGTHVALIGRNGSGKSTIARLMNGLLLPDEGLVTMNGKRTDDDRNIYEIRRECAMVFQNPDNQIIGTTVKDDVAFGPSNLGLSRDEIWARVDASLQLTGLSDLKERAPHELSGGQKQKLAIASILAMRPDCLVLDEATAMLDPEARHEVMALVKRLKKEEKLTVVQITHHMEEALLADLVYVISDGSIAFYGTPAEVFNQVERVKQEGLDVPTHLEIAHLIHQETHVPFDSNELIHFDGAVRYVREALDSTSVPNQQNPSKEDMQVEETAPILEPEEGDMSEVIKVDHLSYTYDTEGLSVLPALDEVSLQVKRGEILGLVGHTGSGKSTLIQHFNGLIRARKGKVVVLDRDLSDKKQVSGIRRHVGLLFQYPEDQLFEETVALDIAFAPKQQKKRPDEVERAVLRAAKRLGITEILDRSPFELSGGQRRRVAIAGVLAAETEILILDEPAAGLDPKGRDDLFRDLLTLTKEGVTLVIVSHDMEMMTRYSDRILVMNEGRVAGVGTPFEITQDEQFLKNVHLETPPSKRFLDEFSDLVPQKEKIACFCPLDVKNALLNAIKDLSVGGITHG